MNYSKFSSAEDRHTAQAIKLTVDTNLYVVGHTCQCLDLDKFLKDNPKIDGAIRGEFDFTALDLANEIPMNEIKGLTWKHDERIVHNPDRSPATSEQLEKFPFVTDVYKRHLNIRKYRQAPQLWPFVDMFTGRGCYWSQCIFCLWPFTLNKGAFYRTRSIRNVIEEIFFIKEKLPYVKEVFIQDDTLPPWRAKQLSQAIIDEELDLTWSCYARPEKNMTLDLLRLMKRAGCRCLHVGYETSDQQILNAVKKGVTPETMMKFTENANRAGLIIHADFIVGLPDETVDTIRQTIDWAKKLKVHSYQFMTPKVYENTPLYEEIIQCGGTIQEGEVSYPHLSNEELQKWTRIATKACLLNPPFIKRLLLMPSQWARVVPAAINILPLLLGGKNEE
jgi:radical SAM superfamily enzyme YgiQ (UPF0313 family)